MGDRQLLWLNLANVALGLVVLILTVGTLIAVAVEFAVRAHRKLRRDAELRHPFRYLR